MDSIEDVRARYEETLMAIPGVVGVGVEAGRILVYTSQPREEVASRVPSRLEGYDVGLEFVGEIEALE